jgi:putative ABC transport system permease protein
MSTLHRAWTHLLRHAWSTAAVVVVLSCGVGLCSGAFSVAWGVFLRGLPFDHPRRIVRVAIEVRGEKLAVAATDYLHWRAGQSAFAALAAWQGSSVNFSPPDQGAEHLNGAYISHEAFAALSVHPALGHAFTAEDEKPGAAPVVIVGDQVWRTLLAGDPRALGTTVRVDGEPATLIGVMPPGFGFPLRQEVWLPLRLDPAVLAAGRGPRLQVFGRLRPGITPGQARENLQVVAATAARGPEARQAPVPRVVVEPYVLSYTEDLQPAIYLLLGGSLLLLLTVCANVAILAYAGGVARGFEHAVCLALGATRGQLGRLLLAESALLALASAALSFPIAFAIERLYAGIEGDTLRSFWMTLDLRGLPALLAIVVTALAAMAGHFLPARRALRSDPAGALRQEASPPFARRRGRPALGLIALEFAACTVLLLAMALLLLSFRHRARIDLGARPEQVLTAQLMLPLPRYAAPAARLSFLDQLRDHLAAAGGMGGDARVALSSSLAGNSAPTVNLEIAGMAPAGEQPLDANLLLISPQYFAAVGEPVLLGRDFSLLDRGDSEPVTIVAQSLGKLFPGRTAIGQRIRLRLRDNWGSWRRVVGVVPDYLAAGDGLRPAANVFLPLSQSPASWLSLLVRTSGDPRRLTGVVRSEISRLDHDVPLFAVWSMAERRDDLTRDSRSLAAIFSAFGLVAFALALIGAYGVTALSAMARAHEMAVRMALGAARSTVIGATLGRAMAEVAIGLAAGLLLVAALHRFLASLLVDLAPLDPMVLALVCAAEAAIAAGACLPPAAHAALGKPFARLRSQ